MPRLTGPASEPAGLRLRQLVRSRMIWRSTLRAGLLVNLVAQGERVHVQLHRELIDGLFKGEAALRMARRAKRRARTGIDEDVVLFRQQVGALVHIGRRAGGSRRRYPRRRFRS